MTPRITSRASTIPASTHGAGMPKNPSLALPAHFIGCRRLVGSWESNRHLLEPVKIRKFFRQCVYLFTFASVANHFERRPNAWLLASFLSWYTPRFAPFLHGWAFLSQFRPCEIWIKRNKCVFHNIEIILSYWRHLSILAIDLINNPVHPVNPVKKKLTIHALVT